VLNRRERLLLIYLLYNLIYITVAVLFGCSTIFHKFSLGGVTSVHFVLFIVCKLSERKGTLAVDVVHF